MEAKDSRMGSYAWRSILIGRDVIQRGARWRVGDGKKIKIWQDHWLPKKHPPQVFSYPVAEFESAKVDILIDSSRRQWNEEMIDGLFKAKEAELIKSIPLSREASEDILFWPHSSNGHYTCKIGYKFLKMEEELNGDSQMAINNEKELWKGVWSMCVPPKVKTLMRHACREAMPTKCALFRRTIAADHFCVRCHSAVEDSLHALWSCTKLDAVWSDTELWRVRGSAQFMMFKELLSWQASKATPVQQPRRPRNNWRPLPSELFKINFDGVVFPREKKSVIGFVIKDHRGLVIASCSKLVHQELCSADVEAMVAGCALSFALDVGVKRAGLECDSLTVIKWLMEEERLLVPLGLLIEDAKQSAQHFDKLLYSHVKRECNFVAHSLARYAIGILDFLVWIDDIPPQFYDVLQVDLIDLIE
ncbi:uncharacterized protein LOC142610490 [Castanea sativa]|uniref:uncharacterized protein LOC142610490 n=1 Tax=Castanea sativa TaxID=21020 RepID=UPI003F652080